MHKYPAFSAKTRANIYLHEHRVIVDKKSQVFLKKPFTYDGAHLFLILHLTLLTYVPQTFTQLLKEIFRNFQ